MKGGRDEREKMKVERGLMLLSTFDFQLSTNYLYIPVFSTDR
jgi:hypothetical protein